MPNSRVMSFLPLLLLLAVAGVRLSQYGNISAALHDLSRSEREFQEARKKNLIEAHFNVLNLTPGDVTFDMVSWGSSAVSQEQQAGLMIGDEAYAGSRNFEDLQAAVSEVLGLPEGEEAYVLMPLAHRRARDAR